MASEDVMEIERERKKVKFLKSFWLCLHIMQLILETENRLREPPSTFFLGNS